MLFLYFCIKGGKNLCIVFQHGLNNVQSVLLGMRPTRYFQLCSPPLQLKGILIGWGMSATSCITEREPIMPAAGWCISDVWNSWVQLGGCFQEAGRERCEAECCRQQPAFFLVCWASQNSPKATVLSCGLNTGLGIRKSEFCF